MHRMRFPNKGQRMPVDPNGTTHASSMPQHARERRGPLDEETGHALRQSRSESENIPMPNLAGLIPVIGFAAESYQTEVDNYPHTPCDNAGTQVCRFKYEIPGLSKNWQPVAYAKVAASKSSTALPSTRTRRYKKTKASVENCAHEE